MLDKALNTLLNIETKTWEHSLVSSLPSKSQFLEVALKN